MLMAHRMGSDSVELVTLDLFVYYGFVLVSKPESDSNYL